MASESEPGSELVSPPVFLVFDSLVEEKSSKKRPRRKFSSRWTTTKKPYISIKENVATNSRTNQRRLRKDRCLSGGMWTDQYRNGGDVVCNFLFKHGEKK
eukprot:86812_1